MKNANPEGIILFGFYAYGEPYKDSDLDVLAAKDVDGDKCKKSRLVGRDLRGAN